MASSPEDEDLQLTPESPGSPVAFPSPPSLLETTRSTSGSANSRNTAASHFAAGMTPSSTPLGNVNAARRPPMPATLSARGGGLTQDLQERMRNFHLARQGAPKPQPGPGTPGGGGVDPSRIMSPTGPPPVATGGLPSNIQLPPGFQRPTGASPVIAPTGSPAGGPKLSLAQKRGMALPGGFPGGAVASPQSAGPVGGGTGRKKPGLTLSQMNAGQGPDAGNAAGNANSGSMLDKFSQYIDKKTGSLTFKDKAVIHNKGIDFSGGHSFSISLDEIETLDELGKGNYGAVYKVRHSKPQMRRPGLGLAGNKVAQPSLSAPVVPTSPRSSENELTHASTNPLQPARGNTSGVTMAMKEMRLELEDAKFSVIIMELDILHRCISPYIVDFYGAFFQEGAVYICMEFMDGGSLDKLYGDGVPEEVLRKITYDTVMGLKCLKDDHNIIHRDVKPTNILCNTRGQVKICDFGVSGNLVASIAKTNIGCQSYMAPERISSGGVAAAGAGGGGGTYSVQSDIWSLGLTVIECALGRYPYPPETYNNIFSQLSAIVDGTPPDLPSENFSEAAHDFVHGCLNKIPKLRPTYSLLLQHAWLAPLLRIPTIMEEPELETEHEAEIAHEAGQAAPAPGAEEQDPADAARHALGAESRGGVTDAAGSATTEDPAVAKWVVEQLEKKARGKLDKAKVKPALHQAPLDAVDAAGSS